MSKRADVASSASRESAAPKAEFMPHIEGIRALAVLLVVVYHVFSERSAGAVDVFFVLTGFLVVGSLLRRFDQGLKGIRSFLSALFLRLGPVSLTVLLLTALGSLVFIPAVNLLLTNRQIIASAIYLQNWQLIAQEADYLDRLEPPSPVVHFWAMSVQMQFYLLTALVFALLVLIYRASAKTTSVRTTLVVIFVAAFVVSLAYSIYQTHFGSSDRAYFDTFTRFWEFAMGGLLALAMSKWPDLSIPKIWGWVGFFGVISAGLFVSPILPFPGFAALVPTLSTVLMILGARDSGKASAASILSLPWMVSLGGVAYTLYLVHWPILIFYRRSVDNEVSIPVGLGIIALSIALSYLLRRTVEEPLLARRYGARPGRLLALTTIPLLVGTVAISGTGLLRAEAAFDGESLIHPNNFLVELEGPFEWYPESVDPRKVIPPFELIWYAKPPSYYDKASSGVTCHALWADREDIAWCEYGETENPSATVALVGASHAAQWLPAVDYIAKERGWRVMYKTAADCRFASKHPSDPECDTVSEKMLAGILEMTPDLVFTIANNGDESAPGDYRVEYWERLREAGIPVVAIRDNPWFDESPTGCLNRHLDEPLVCATPTDDVLAKEFSMDGVPDNVRGIDLTEYYCDEDYCPAIIGDVLVWRDHNHFTRQFVLTMTRPLERALDEVWGAPERSQVNSDAVARLLTPQD